MHNPLHEAGKAVFDMPMKDMLTGEEIGTECAMKPLSIRVLTEA